MSKKSRASHLYSSTQSLMDMRRRPSMMAIILAKRSAICPCSISSLSKPSSSRSKYVIEVVTRQVWFSLVHVLRVFLRCIWSIEPPDHSCGHSGDRRRGSLSRGPLLISVCPWSSFSPQLIGLPLNISDSRHEFSQDQKGTVSPQTSAI